MVLLLLGDLVTDKLGTKDTCSQGKVQRCPDMHLCAGEDGRVRVCV